MGSVSVLLVLLGLALSELLLLSSFSSSGSGDGLLLSDEGLLVRVEECELDDRGLLLLELDVGVWVSSGVIWTSTVLDGSFAEGEHIR